jgi:uncharacterized membrane protein
MGKNKHRHDTNRDQRRSQFSSRPSRRRGISWTWVIGGAAALFVASVVFAGKGGEGGAAARGLQAAEVLPAGQDVSLPASLFDDGSAKFYRYTSAIGREIRFFVLKSSDGVIRAAFDACDVCYRERKGYHREGDVMVCNNCGRSFRSVDVNVITGGCNPGPLQRTIDNGRVTIKTASLDLGAAYF